MSPGMEPGQMIMVNKFAYVFDRPDRGDIVYYKSTDSQQYEMKRIIGLPGDVITIDDAGLHINGILVQEPYVKYGAGYQISKFQVPLGSCLVLSDNRNYTDDSSLEWTVRVDDIEGRAWVLTWPPDRWGMVSNYSLSSQLAAVGLY